jgi:hypothetical protein
MPDQEAKILSHVSNSGIVHLPGRKYPAVAIQGDTLYRLFTAARYLLGEAKRLKDEERYFEILMLTEELQGSYFTTRRRCERMVLICPTSTPSKISW